MYVEEMSLMSGEKFDEPRVHWEEEDKYAIIAFLLLSLDKNVDQDGNVRFDDLFGLNEPIPETGEDGGENPETRSKRETRDAIVRECEKFLGGLDGLNSDERYDAIVDEIDRFIAGEDAMYSQCNIGGSYRTFGGRGKDKLDGGAYRLWDLVRLAITDTGYGSNKRRLLKHLARKWDIESSALPVLESAARLLPEIAKKRKELSESDLPHREVLAKLAELDTEEKEVWRQLKSHGVAETLAASAYIASRFGVINAFRALNGEDPIRPDINELEENADGDDEEYKEPGLSDKIGDAIEEGIMKVTEGICAPFEWMTEKLMGL